MALRDIGEAAFDQRGDHRDHPRDVLGGARLVVGRQRVQRRHVGMIGGGRPGGQAADVLARGVGGGDDLVLDVGDVADVYYMRLAVGRA